MNRVKAAFFSFTPPAPPDDDGSYLRWHLLDHMPEQYRLPGIQLGRSRGSYEIKASSSMAARIGRPRPMGSFQALSFF